jgi:hypothetical protein
MVSKRAAARAQQHGFDL